MLNTLDKPRISLQRQYLMESENRYSLYLLRAAVTRLVKQTMALTLRITRKTAPEDGPEPTRRPNRAHCTNSFMSNPLCGCHYADYLCGRFLIPLRGFPCADSIILSWGFYRGESIVGIPSFCVGIPSWALHHFYRADSIISSCGFQRAGSIVWIPSYPDFHRADSIIPLLKGKG